MSLGGASALYTSRAGDQDGASALYTSRAGDQDGASAPTLHPSSPRRYARGIWHPLVGGTLSLVQ